jgi:hypothetical protein
MQRGMRPYISLAGCVRRNAILTTDERIDVIYITSLKPSGQYIYHQLNIQQLYILPTQCIYVFCVVLRTTSDYFPIQHQLTGFYNRDIECLLHGTN